MTAPTMEWTWAEGPNPINGSITLAVTVAGQPGYSYYNRTRSTPWTLIAVAADERQAVEWFAHRVDPQPAPDSVAAELDVLAKDVTW